MNCIYINLESELQRKESLETSFITHRQEGWTLTRLQAIDADAVTRVATKGRITDGEKGCFLSHIQAIESSLQSPGHVLIVEDDTLFGPHSCQIISEAVESMPSATWDILFTDVCIPTVHSMLDLFLLRRQLVAARQFKTVNLKEIRFAGSTAYVVNARSKQKLVDLLKGTPVLDVPYDLALRNFICGSALVAFVAFPFATSLSNHADVSQLQGGDMEINDAIWNAFRRLMWADRNIGDVTKRLDLVGGAFLDAETIAFAKVLAIMLSPKLPNK